MKKSSKYAIIASIGVLFALIGYILIFDYETPWRNSFIGIGFIVAFIWFIVFAVLSFKAYYGKQESEERKNQKPIKIVEILGSRLDIENSIPGTYDFVIYSLLVIYMNGEREVVECRSKSERFNELSKYIKVRRPSKQSKPLSIDEMIEFDEMEE